MRSSISTASTFASCSVGLERGQAVRGFDVFNWASSMLARQRPGWDSAVVSSGHRRSRYLFHVDLINPFSKTLVSREGQPVLGATNGYFFLSLQVIHLFKQRFGCRHAASSRLSKLAKPTAGASLSNRLCRRPAWGRLPHTARLRCARLEFFDAPHRTSPEQKRRVMFSTLATDGISFDSSAGSWQACVTRWRAKAAIT